MKSIRLKSLHFDEWFAAAENNNNFISLTRQIPIIRLASHGNHG